MTDRTGLALDAGNAVVGARGHDHDDIDSGAAYVFLLDDQSE